MSLGARWLPFRSAGRPGLSHNKAAVLVLGDGGSGMHRPPARLRRGIRGAVSQPGGILVVVQSAFDRERDQVVDARLTPNFQIEVVGKRREDGSFPYGCRVCGADVVGKGGHGTKVRAYFAHQPGEACGYGSAPESEEHRQLKTAVAQCILRREGWEADLEVPDSRWRVDVLARHFFDLDAVYASRSAQERSRVVAFEVQHTRQRPGTTHDRTERYRKAGYEVVWIFDHQTPLGPYPAVRVERIAGPERWEVVEGIWARRRLTQRMDLCDFVGAVLAGGVSHELLPSYTAASPAPSGGLAGRSFPIPIREALALRPGAAAARKGRLYAAKEGPERAWVLAGDLDVLRIRRDRAVATSWLMERLREAGADARLSRIDDQSAAYATIVEVGGRRVAVHPRPSQAQEMAVLDRLAGSSAVIARDEGDRQDLRRRLPAGPVRILLSDELDVVALASVLTPPPQPPTATPPATPAPPPRRPTATPTRRPRRVRHASLVVLVVLAVVLVGFLATGRAAILR